MGLFLFKDLLFYSKQKTWTRQRKTKHPTVIKKMVHPDNRFHQFPIQLKKIIDNRIN